MADAKVNLADLEQTLAITTANRVYLSRPELAALLRVVRAAKVAQEELGSPGRHYPAHINNAVDALDVALAAIDFEARRGA